MTDLFGEVATAPMVAVKRAQALLQPRRYGQQPPPITPRHQGEIPNALKSRRGG